MPTLPASGYPVPVAPSIAPATDIPGNRQQIAGASAEAFGGYTADALKGLGGAFKESASSFENIWKFHQETDADSKSFQAQLAVNKLMHGNPDTGDPGIMGLQGEAGLAELPRRRKEVEDVMRNAYNSLGTQYAAARFNNDIQRFRNYTLAEIGRKYDQEVKRVRVDTFKGQTELNKTQAVQAATLGDLPGFKERLADIETWYREKGPGIGMTPASIEADIARDKAAVAREYVQTEINRNPLNAEAMLKDPVNRTLLGPHLPELEARAQGAAREYKAQGIVNGTYVPKEGGALVRGGALQAATANIVVPEIYKGTIASAAQKYGVPEDLLTRVLHAESGFDPNAVSPTGAKGIAQFIRSTARERGVNPTDPNSAIPGAASYLRDLRDKTGSWEGALRGYLGSDPRQSKSYINSGAIQTAIALDGGSGGSGPAPAAPSAGSEAAPETATVSVAGSDGKMYNITPTMYKQYLSIQSAETKQQFLVEAAANAAKPATAPAAVPVPPPEQGELPDSTIPGLTERLQAHAQNPDLIKDPVLANRVFALERQKANVTWAEQQHARQAAQQKQAEVDEKVLSEFQARMAPGHPNPPSKEEILSVKGISSQAQRTLYDFYLRTAKPEPEKDVSAQTYRRLYQKLLDGNLTMQEINDAFTAEPPQLSRADHEKLEARFKENQGEREKDWNAAFKEVMKVVEPRIMPAISQTLGDRNIANAMDPGGAERVMRWHQAVQAKMQEYRAAGKNPMILLQPGTADKPNPEYIGNESFILGTAGAPPSSEPPKPEVKVDLSTVAGLRAAIAANPAKREEYIAEAIRLGTVRPNPATPTGSVPMAR